MEHLKARTRTDTGPEGLPAVCVSCHPADAGSLDSICSALLNARNCAVCCAEDMSSPVPEAELSRMILFVFPVSTRFFTEPNRAADVDLPFALKNRIPVLPVLTEPGLEDSVPLQEKFGRLQCLSCLPAPPEELTFQEALTLYLEQVLISGALVRRLQDAAEAGTLQADSTYLSGLAHLYGICAETDRARALKLITRAAEAGLPEAMGTLAAMYRTGNGAPVDPAAAAKWQAGCADAVEDRQGPDSAEAVLARYRLFEYCRDFGRTSEAETVLLGSRPGTDKSILSAMAGLASRMMADGKYRDAVVLAKQAYACTRDFCGTDERAVLHASCIIGWYGISAGEYEKSRALLEEVLEKQTALLGEKDPDTLAAMSALGEVYSCMGDQKKAQDLLTRAAAGRREVLGEEDRDTLTTLRSLAGSYEVSGGCDRAEEILKHVLTVQQRTLGDRDPETITTRCSLAMLFRWRGDPATARKQLAEVLEVQQETIGRNHPDTLTTMAGIAACCTDAGDHRQARQLLETVAAAYRKTLGSSHPVTLTIMNNLALECFRCGEKEKALKTARSILAVQRRTLGEKNPATLQTMYNLSLLCFGSGLHSEAAALMEQTAAARSEVLGRDHPDTIQALEALDTFRGEMRRPQQKRKHSSRKKKRR